MCTNLAVDRFALDTSKPHLARSNQTTKLFFVNTFYTIPPTPPQVSCFGRKEIMFHRFWGAEDETGNHFTRSRDASYVVW